MPTENALGAGDYAVTAGAGPLGGVAVDQAASAGQWVTLGRYPAAWTGLSVQLTPGSATLTAAGPGAAGTAAGNGKPAPPGHGGAPAAAGAVGAAGAAGRGPARRTAAAPPNPATVRRWRRPQPGPPAPDRATEHFSPPALRRFATFCRVPARNAGVECRRPGPPSPPSAWSAPAGAGQ